MRKPTTSEIETAEDELQTAMLDSNVAALGKLLSTTLIFTNHLGHRLGKEDDLAAHRSGMLRIASIRRSEQLLIFVNYTAVVSVRARMSGTYDGHPVNGDFRFTRLWTAGADDTAWEVAVAHSTLVV